MASEWHLKGQAPPTPARQQDGSVSSESVSPTSVMAINSAVLDNAPPMDLKSKARGTKRPRKDSPPSSDAKRPSASGSKGKKVRFDRDSANGKIRKEAISSITNQCDVNDLWSSRAELRETFRECDLTLKEVKKDNGSYVQEIIRLFSECSNQKCNVPKLIKTHQSILLNPPREDLRGLERQMHKMLSQYRTFHVKSILKVQKKLTKSEEHRRMLRSMSMRTSRVSRAWSIILAHGDNMQVHKMIKQELHAKSKPTKPQDKKPSAMAISKAQKPMATTPHEPTTTPQDKKQPPIKRLEVVDLTDSPPSTPGPTKSLPKAVAVKKDDE